MKSLLFIGLVWLIGMLWIFWMFAVDAQADEWAFFYPELVRTYGCRVRPVEIYSGQQDRRDVWEAEAYAERIQEGNRVDHWDFVLGYFDYTDRGARKAGKACFKWREEAAKRVRMAQR